MLKEMFRASLGIQSMLDEIKYGKDGKEKISEISMENLVKIHKKYSDKYRANKQRRIALYLSLFITFSMAVACVMAAAYSNSPFDHWGGYVFSGYLLILLPLIVAIIFNTNDNMQSIKFTILLINSEIFTREIKDLDERTRAEKIYKDATNEMREFYTINTRHIKLLFPLGIALLFIGLAIIVFSLFIMRGDNVNIIVGVVAGILSNFIGAIFITMYNKNMDNSVAFFDRLRTSTNMLYLNIIVSQINDDAIKNQTLSDIAASISKKN